MIPGGLASIVRILRWTPLLTNSCSKRFLPQRYNDIRFDNGTTSRSDKGHRNSPIDQWTILTFVTSTCCDSCHNDIDIRGTTLPATILSLVFTILFVVDQLGIFCCRDWWYYMSPNLIISLSYDEGRCVFQQFASIIWQTRYEERSEMSLLQVDCKAISGQRAEREDSSLHT